LDICATTFYPALPVIDLIPKIIKHPRDRHEKSRDDLRRGLDRREIDTINWYLKGIMMYVTHRSDRRKPKYKISYVDNQPADLAKFKQGNKETTVAKYFRDTYGQSLQYARLPCIVVVKPHDKSKSYFPLEVCEICPGMYILYTLMYFNVFFINKFILNEEYYLP